MKYPVIVRGVALLCWVLTSHGGAAPGRPLVCVPGTALCLVDLRWDKTDGDRIRGAVNNGSDQQVAGLEVTFILKSENTVTAEAYAQISTGAPPRGRWNFAATPILTSEAFASYTDEAEVSGILEIPGPNGLLLRERVHFNRVWNPTARRERSRWEKEQSLKSK